MNKDKIKMAIIYILIFIILGLVGYLIYFSLNQNTKEEEKPVTKEPEVTTGVPDIAQACTFDVTLPEYSAIASGTSATKSCTGLNKLNIKDVVLNGKTQDLIIIYTTGVDIKDTGLYLNGQKIIQGATSTIQNLLGIFDSKLFILTKMLDGGNVEVYNDDGISVYNLANALNNAQINDSAFMEIVKTNPNFNPLLSIKNVDMNSFSFTEGEFTFSSDTKLGCNGYPYKGSNYKVTYTGNTFELPLFLNTNACK